MFVYVGCSHMLPMLHFWLGRRQQDSPSCFCTQSVALPQVTLSYLPQENSMYSHMGMNMNRADNIMLS